VDLVSNIVFITLLNMYMFDIFKWVMMYLLSTFLNKIQQIEDE